MEECRLDSSFKRVVIPLSKRSNEPIASGLCCVVMNPIVAFFAKSYKEAFFNKQIVSPPMFVMNRNWNILTFIEAVRILAVAILLKPSSFYCEVNPLPVSQSE